MSSVFSENDLRLLEKTISIREKLIDNIASRELPTKDKDLVAFTNLLESVDRSIFNKAKVRIEDTNSKSSEETKAILRDLLLSLHRGDNNNEVVIEAQIPEYVSTNESVSEGELILKSDELDLERVKNNI